MGFLSRLFGTKAAPAVSSPRRADQMVSLVALVPSWREIPVTEVRETLDRVFPGAFLPARDEGSFVLDGPAPGASFLVQCTVPGNSGLFDIRNVPGPYSDFSNYLSHLADPKLRELASAQDCWMSVDLMHRHSTDEEAYQFIGKVLAQLAPADAAVLLHPSTFVAAEFSPELRRILAAGGTPFGSA